MGVNINFFVSGLDTTAQRDAFKAHLAGSTEPSVGFGVFADGPVVVVGSWMRYLSGDDWDCRGRSWPFVHEQASAVVAAASAANPDAVVRYGSDVLDVTTEDDLLALRLPVIDASWFETMDAAHGDPAKHVMDGRVGTWRVRAPHGDNITLTRAEEDGPLVSTWDEMRWTVASMDYFTEGQYFTGITVGERVQFTLTELDCDHLPCPDCTLDVTLDVATVEAVD